MQGLDTMGAYSFHGYKTWMINGTRLRYVATKVLFSNQLIGQQARIGKETTEGRKNAQT